LNELLHVRKRKVFSELEVIITIDLIGDMQDEAGVLSIILR